MHVSTNEHLIIVWPDVTYMKQNL